MCPDNLTEFSRQEQSISRQEDGVRTIQVYQVTGKKNLKAIRRKIRDQNKENIPPLLREEATLSSQTEYVTKAGDECHLAKETGHDAAQHSSPPN